MLNPILKAAFDACVYAVRQMSKEQRESWADFLFWRKLSEAIKINREARGWSQAELGKKCGMLQPAIARLESGKLRNVSTATLRRIAAAFDCVLRIGFVSWGEWIEFVITPTQAAARFADDPMFK